MKFGIRTRLFLILSGVIGLSVLVVYVYAKRAATENAEHRIERDVRVRLSLVTDRVQAARYDADDVPRWDSLADALGEASASRVTIVSRTGRVLGDSRVPLAEVADTDDHSFRPEVRAALAGKIGSSQRYSVTVGREMYYFAAPLQREGQILGAVRVALPMDEVDEDIGSLRGVLIAASILALVVSLAVALVAVQVASRRISLLTKAAGQMAGGNLDVRARFDGVGELAELGAALDRLAKNLTTSLSALRGERDRMEAILSSMKEGVLFLDDHGRIGVVNPALRDMLFLQGEVAGKPLLEVVRHAELKELLDAVLSGQTGLSGDTPETHGAAEQEIQVSGLKPRQLLVRARRLEQLPSGVVAVFLDVTETRRLENLRREFVANVSHELRTPVTSIRSATETLQIALVSDPKMVPRFLDIIDRNAARLHALVEDVLDLSRIESRQFVLNPEPISVAAVVAQCLSTFEERARERSVHLTVRAEEDLPELLLDPSGVEHILTNLVDNAVKYAGAGKEVAIILSRASGPDGAAWAELAVQDNGPGIDAKHLPRLFERFYRVDAGRSRELGGTGLGLAIVKHLAESMGGSVKVNSTVGEGTRFSVLLARLKPPGGAVAEASQGDTLPPESGILPS